jgi:phenylacetate-CoA ligase
MALNVFAPAADLIRGTHTMSSLRELEASQWWPRERIDELQAGRLNRLITHAYEHVPYYRQIMDERGLKPADILSAADLRKLPIQTKATIRDAGDSILSDGFTRAELRPMSTSGSTGEPFSFYSSAEDQLSHGMARALLALQWAGLRIGDRYATLIRPRHYSRWREQLLHRMSQRVRRAVELDYGSLSDDHTALLARQLQLGRFTCLDGTPPLLCLLAGFIRSRGLDAPRVQSIVCSGEQLYPHERQLLRETFGSEPYSVYSSFEVFEIAGECQAHAGLHVHAEDIVVELVDEAGMPAPAGHAGHILITNLHNYVMPFVRYAIGDIGTLDSTPCSCGRHLPRLVGVVGRTSELIVAPDGRRVFAADLGLESFGSLGVKQFRIVQNERDKVIALIVWHEDVSPDARAERGRQIAETLRGRVGPGIEVKVETVEHIEPTAAGKHLVVVSRLASRFPYGMHAADAGTTEDAQQGRSV